MPVALSLLLAAAALAPAWGQEAPWPDLSSPAREVGGGEHDAAVVVGVEDYRMVPVVPGAKANAKQWYEYLTETRGVPARNVKFLTNDDATREEILEASRQAAGRAGPKGTLWFVFVGHGAPSPDGKDGLLIGVDAQQKVGSLQARGIRRQELLNALGQSRAGAIRVVLDACFSGRGQDGASIAPKLQPLVTVAAIGSLDPRMVVLTAAKGDQFAGALPGASKPAFSYLVLGGLRGWAAKGKKKALTAGDLWRYATDALDATLRGRDQTPDLLGDEDALMGVSAGEMGPSLSRLAAATAGGGKVRSRADAAPEAPKADTTNGLAAADIGALKVVLKVIRPVREDNGVQGMQWVFDFINTSPQEDLLAAAVSVESWPSGNVIQSQVIDSNGLPWGLSRISGLSDVRGYRGVKGDQLAQYAMNGKHMSDAGGYLNTNDNPWFGGFTVIPAGQSKRITLSFLPSGDPNGSRSGRLSDSFQFQSELITCKGSLERMKKCSSTTLVFDDVNPPKNK